MPSALSQRYFEIVSKHLESGVPLKDMNLAPDQRRRAEVCLAVYSRYQSNPMMDIDRYLRNVFKRTPAEIRNDKKLISYIISLMSEGSKKISEDRVRYVGNKLIRMGEGMGDWKPMEAGAKLLIKVDKLEQPDAMEDIEENTFKLPPVLTTDVQDIDKDRKNYSREEMDRIRRKYGGTKDHIQEMVETRTGEFVARSEADRMTGEDIAETEFKLPEWDLEDMPKTDETDETDEREEGEEEQKQLLEDEEE